MPNIINSNLSPMKSKYLDINKFKEAFEQRQNDKNSRKQTKPKKSLKTYLANQNQTESDFKPQSIQKYTKKLKLPNKKPSKQIPKSQKVSPKRFNQVKFEESSQNNEIYSNHSIQERKHQSSQRQSRLLTDSPHQTNFIGQLNNYLNELKRSKLDLIQNEEAVQNETLLINKLNLLNKQKSLENTLQKSSDRWERKIKKEKSINRNLQKCIIEIQKVLWDRNDKLQMLEEEIRKGGRQKQNFARKANDKQKQNLSRTIFFNKDYANKTQPIQRAANKNIIFHQKQNPLNQLSKISSREQKIQGLYDTYSDTQKESEATFKEKLPQRRKTQTPLNIEKIIQRTLASQAINKPKRDKTYNRFRRQELNDV